MIEFQSEYDRRSFLKYAALVGAGASLVATGTTAFAATSPSPSPSTSPSASSGGSSKFGEGDVGILNYALTLEYLEAEFYSKGVQGNALGDNLAYVNPIAEHEAAHVKAITAILTKLGATPVSKPTFTFPDGIFTDSAKFLATAAVFEETGVKAYHGQVPLIMSGEILGAAASIAGVESRHASVLNLILQKKPVPAPFEAHATMDEIVAAIKPYLGA